MMMTLCSAAGISSMRLTKTSSGMLAQEIAAQWVQSASACAASESSLSGSGSRMLNIASMDAISMGESGTGSIR